MPNTQFPGIATLAANVIEKAISYSAHMQKSGRGANLNTFGYEPEQILASLRRDAHLLNAAPDLLDALERMVEEFAEHVETDAEGRRVIAARYAIAKAKGPA